MIAALLARVRARRVTIAATVIVCAGAGVSAHAQSTGSVSGTVRDSTGGVVQAAEVVAIGLPRRTFTDSAGRYRLDQLPAGRWTLRARRLGHRALELTTVIGASEEARSDFVLARLPLRLQPVVVNARSNARSRQLAGFYERRRWGHGRYLTQDRIDRHPQMSLPQLLSVEIPGVRVVSGRFVRESLRFRANSCPPLVFLDGAAATASEFDLGAIATISVAAIEVYPGPATVPAEFQVARGLHTCGVVAIWSRMWDGERRRPSRKKLASLDSALAQLKVYAADEVDQPARVDSTGLVTPVYPDSMSVFRVAGEVVAEFVVDTTGEVRVESVGIVSASHPSFAEPVRNAILGTRFIPALLNGRRVPQQVLLPFRFDVTQPEKR